ncbi:hypothetical protein Moror_5615 [Moniliophthora roreri MCA 2997]|uniref:Uncharacterized protein n=1 Tax=Moniliophthora roreri (strain MCA 2997) TaxID=1381753 RepID=V2X6Q7_MONRO|nr:hypothetical protein Moror_5615 [Moniliophthora roreri MCA 2997]
MLRMDTYAAGSRHRHRQSLHATPPTMNRFSLVKRPSSLRLYDILLIPSLMVRKRSLLSVGAMFSNPTSSPVSKQGATTLMDGAYNFQVTMPRYQGVLFPPAIPDKIGKCGEAGKRERESHVASQGQYNLKILDFFAFDMGTWLVTW